MAYKIRSSVRRLRMMPRPTRPTKVAKPMDPPAPATDYTGPTTSATYSADELDAMTYNDLRAMATERGVDSTGKKAELVARLAE